MKAKRQWKSRQIGNRRETMLVEDGNRFVIALVGLNSFHDTKPELRLVCDPRTGKRWASMKAARQWLDGALRSHKRKV